MSRNEFDVLEYPKENKPLYKKKSEEIIAAFKLEEVHGRVKKNKYGIYEIVDLKNFHLPPITGRGRGHLRQYLANTQEKKGRSVEEIMDENYENQIALWLASTIEPRDDEAIWDIPITK